MKKVSLICVYFENNDEDDYKLNILNDGLFHNYIVYLQTKQIQESILSQLKIKVEFEEIIDSGYLQVTKFAID